MEWKEKPAFGGFLIWVAEVEGHWIASTAALPQHGAMATAGPGDHVIPAEFARLARRARCVTAVPPCRPSPSP